MHDDHYRHQQRTNDYYRSQRERSSRWDSEDRRRRNSDDLHRHWEEHGYPGFWEIVGGLILFFGLIAIMAGR
ncbi:hypothetical protein BKA00_005135 [Actinomadura coerulea]|uniref:Uncharacterized protein n=1 Tax=Actinomadura coerulea TaxID=46159 RepID=A0A7X0L133_9ACTN|nr:hypothetical protein [Actinomadura coerulea]MBB6398221.1 hypothetical protein [Actinomadura coerulea]GGQ11251.1 hypothetical protein GCM10010187_29480 [Actinomadura coerulea]